MISYRRDCDFAIWESKLHPFKEPFLGMSVLLPLYLLPSLEQSQRLYLRKA